jgi:16S rRNA (cytosine1402-N4)-methyltransferase
MSIHQPVMVEEVLRYLNVRPGARYIDATYGAGGHARQILERGGLVLGLDVSPTSIAEADQHPHLKLVRGNFNNLLEVARSNGFDRVSGVLFDLGISSDELAEIPGISFNRDEPLDMRLDPGLGVTAADLVNALPERQLAELLSEYGEEPFSRPIAKALVRARRGKKIATSGELAALVARVKGRKFGGIHAATQVFQALRIAVNLELENLRRALPHAQELLEVGGRLVVISFHSGEDRIVKDFMKASSLTILTGKPVTPSEEEIRANPRSRSAKLRAAEH